MTTTYDFTDPPARPEPTRCFDCGSEELVEEYVLLGDGSLAPICFECGWKRRRDAQKRMSEAE